MRNRSISAELIIRIAHALHPDAYTGVCRDGVLVDDGVAGLVFHRERARWKLRRVGEQASSVIVDGGEVRCIISEMASAYEQVPSSHQKVAELRARELRDLSVVEALRVALRRSRAVAGVVGRCGARPTNFEEERYKPD